MISNGYDTEKALAALRPRIGWKQPIGVPVVGTLPVIDDDNKASESGRYYDDFHPVVSVKNLKDVQEYTGLDAAQFNQVLSELKDSVINGMLTAVFSKEQVIDQARMLFRRNADTDLSTIGNTNQFVGFRIRVSEGGYIGQVQKANFLFDANANFTLYVYHEFKATAVYSTQVSVTANELKEVLLPNWLLDNGASYFIGYYQADIGAARAINDPACYAKYKIMGVKGVYVPVTAPNTINKPRYQCTGDNYGMNLQLSSYRDYTEKIILNANLFDELQGLQMAVNLVGEIIYSTRSNATETILNERIDQASRLQQDMNAESSYVQPTSPGLRSRYNKALAKVISTFFPKNETTVTTPST